MLWKLINWFSLIRNIGVLDGFCEDFEKNAPTSDLKNRGPKESALQAWFFKKFLPYFVKELSILWRKSLKPNTKSVFFLGAFGADLELVGGEVQSEIMSFSSISALWGFTKVYRSLFTSNNFIFRDFSLRLKLINSMSLIKSVPNLRANLKENCKEIKHKET